MSYVRIDGHLELKSSFATQYNQNNPPPLQKLSFNFNNKPLILKLKVEGRLVASRGVASSICKYNNVIENFKRLFLAFK